ncbi:MAG: hypothetical protein HY820_17995 [Acidobacteria bacterium]|nr:hypothetical protein [Acidobacteriota bacterium]
MPLLWYLRDTLDMTGTKFGCGMGHCGSCHVDSKATRACVTPMKGAEGKNILTIEGLSTNGDYSVQQVWKTCNVAQCGYCQPGQIVQAAALLKEKPKPSDSRGS